MKKILFLLLPALMLNACVDSLEDWNREQKRAESVPPETLYTSALKSLTDLYTTPNVNTNNFRLYTQQWTTTTYLDEPRYVLTSRLIPQNFWDGLYRDVIADLVEARRLIEENTLLDPAVKNNQIAQLTILEVYAWAGLVNTFGNIPYSEALDFENPLPVYDDAQTIYGDILDRLDAALAQINTSAAGLRTTNELLYASNMTAWVRFGNSVKLKLAMMVADVPELDPDTRVQEAVAAGVISSNGENARFDYISDPPNNNPISANLNPVFTSRQDFVASKTIVDMMNARVDPRRPFYFTTVNGNYVGGAYGLSGNSYSNSSRVATAITDPSFEALLIDYSEVQFLLAEAVERGFIGGSAETYYNAGVTASILYWGGTQADATTYLARADVAYTTAAGDWKQKIGTQKYIAMFNRGWDTWNEWKRLDQPALLPPTGAGVPTNLAIPVRLIYPINEQTLNPANRSAAASAIGGDEATTKVFWDVN